MARLKLSSNWRNLQYEDWELKCKRFATLFLLVNLQSLNMFFIQL